MENGVGITESVAWIVFGAMLLLSLSLGIVLAYHWFRFAMNTAATTTALAAYTIVSGLLLSGMLAALIVFGTSL